MKIADIAELIDKWAPYETAEEYDNVGLLIGDANEEVRGILIALDVSSQVIDEAQKLGANVIVTHHPVIFDAMNEITLNTVQGLHAIALASRGISVISAHTNLDQADGGVSDSMAEIIGLSDISKVKNANGLRIGQFKEPVGIDEFSQRLKEAFSTKVVLAAGTVPDKIESVCVAGGAGGSFIADVKNTKAHVYVTGSIKHEQAIAAKAMDVCVMCLGHYESEAVVLPKVSAYLQKMADEVQSLNGIHVSKIEKSPFDIID